MNTIAIFASGSGSNFEALVQACANGVIPCRVALLVCDKADAFVVQRAKNHNITCFTFLAAQYPSKQAYEQAIVEQLRQAQVDFICLAGYMRIVGDTLLNAYPNKILNIHPALLPSFKGAHAIDDAFAFGVKVFGVTVHLIDHTVDGGTIVAQSAFEYYGNDRDEVEQRIHAIEHQLFPKAINLYLEANKQ